MESSNTTCVNLCNNHTLRVDGSVQALQEQLHSFWELESLGIRPTEDPVQEQFLEDVRRTDGRYQVSLPWRKCHDPLPSNYDLSRKRLQGLLRRLKQEPEVLTEYDKTIQAQLASGIVEKVKSEDEGVQGKVHYLPHHAVIRRDKKTTKVRIVYDASSRSTGPSLNSCLHTGPKFNQKILKILVRFRTYPVAVVGDVEKAFLMISVDPKDRDVLRFLWVNDTQADDPEIVTLRFSRVIFGVSSSPFLLNATIQHHLQKYTKEQPEMVRKITESMYVDDVVGGDDTEQQAYAFYKGSKQILQEGSFNLRKFVTNSPSLQSRIDSEETRRELPSPASTEPLEETYAEATFSKTSEARQGEQTVLGVCWSLCDDHLVFGFREVVAAAETLLPTKRNVVSVIGRFYDPLGYLSPATIRFKIFMQELCKTKMSWDEPLTGEMLGTWKRLVSHLQVETPLRLQRCCISAPVNESTLYRLYGFCDASTRAYAAVIYLAEETPCGTRLTFMVSKTRVAPLKPQTIPRLELLSALLLTRLIDNVTDSLRHRFPLQPPKCFTDSKVALFWIKGLDKEWKPFVQNRVNEIRESTPTSRWSHCPGSMNPADIPSRGITAEDLITNTLWRNGPDLIELPTDAPPDDSVLGLCAAEMKAHSLVTPAQGHVARVGNVINIEHFSRLHKLYRVTALALKFPRIFARQRNCGYKATNHGLKKTNTTPCGRSSSGSSKTNITFGGVEADFKMPTCPLQRHIPYS